MKLSAWILEVGGRKVAARKLGVTPEAIYYWLRKGVTPGFPTMSRIVKLSSGKVTLTDIIEETKTVKTSRVTKKVKI